MPRAYATTTVPIKAQGAQHDDKYTIPEGKRVRVTMVSRFGDVGINDNLEALGYVARVPCQESAKVGYIETPMLTDFEIEPDERAVP